MSVTATRATPQAQTVSPTALQKFVVELSDLSHDEWQYIAEQAWSKGQVSEAAPEAMQAFGAWLEMKGLKDTPEQRTKFIEDLSRRLGNMARKLKLGEGSGEDLARAAAAMSQWSVQDELAFQGLTPRKPTTTRTAPKRPDGFERPTRTQPTKLPQPVPEQYTVVAKTPEQATSVRDDSLATDARLVSQLIKAEGGAAMFEGPRGNVVRNSYNAFLSAYQMGDTPESQQTYGQLLAERGNALRARGKTNMEPGEARRFFAESALARLRLRSPSGNLEIDRVRDNWLVRALSDPSLSLSDEDRKLADRVMWKDPSGLTSYLADERKARAETENQPIPLGAPYKTYLNVKEVFDGGDHAKNAFTLAARQGGYSDEEIRLAAEALTAEGVNLFCNIDAPGRPPVTKADDLKPVVIGGQSFVGYTIEEKAALLLRDARYALQGGHASIADYEKSMTSGWSDTVTGWGKSALETAQRIDKSLGLDQVPVIGSIVRGRYDAMRELTLVGANGAKVAEMFVDETKQFVKTGNPFVTIKGNEQLSRYFDGQTIRAEEAFVDAAKTYPPDEGNMGLDIVRGIVAGGPKIAVNLVPGAAIFYNGLKHLNHDMNEFGKETVIDLAGLAAGFGVGSLAEKTMTSAATTFATRPAIQALVKQASGRIVSAVGGGAVNVALDMGPTALRNQLVDDAALAKMTPQEREAHLREVNEKLTLATAMKNFVSGAVFGLIVPGGKGHIEDLATMARPFTKIIGPVFETLVPGGAKKLYAAVKTLREGKPTTEFIEVDGTHPKVKQAIDEQGVKPTRQADVDMALTQSRMNRMTPKERETFLKGVERYTEKTTMLEVEGAVAKANKVAADEVVQVKTVDQNTVAATQVSRDAFLKGSEKWYGSTPTQKAEVAKVPIETFHDVFGGGALPQAVGELFKVPGFGDFVNANPEGAKRLYLANRYTDVATRAKALYDGGAGGQTFERLLRQVDTDGVTVKETSNGKMYVIEKPPGSDFPLQFIEKDKAFAQGGAYLENGEVTTKYSDQPMRLQVPAMKLLDANGQPLPQDRVAVFGSHGNPWGMAEMNAERLSQVTDLLAQRTDIDAVLLSSCSQGDLGPNGRSNAQNLERAINAQLAAKGLGQVKIEVYASKDAGQTFASQNGATGTYVEFVNKEPRVDRQLVPLVKEQPAVDFVRSQSQRPYKPGTDPTKLNTWPGGNANPTLIYVLRIDRSEQKQKP